MEIKIVKQILEWNEDVSNEVKATLSENSICLINVMGSPGAGKTSLITDIINRLRKTYRIGVIEGDIAGAIDAEKIDKMGIPVVQLQTDGACHIEAMSIRHMLSFFNLDEIDVLIVENIGNLVCPAEFNIGEDFRVAILSIPEGDDKVEKYPLMFETSEALVMNKYDMLPYFEFDDGRVEKNVKDLNKDAKVFRVSTKTGEGAEDFVGWLSDKIAAKIKE
ncbi:MAG: hydrogenase nickel incorporation protein HypB [Oscillospiraceae bacterium]|nr:hydrogenase nickel incorporation protein HypB [Oscillospiraceae bacterium]MBQ6846733.1 hydrogenase nickel incorporation protein HypB [Oscillospiraceae bacterium]MBQ7119681.1 hydrogenase nickel incorporation protein HypB [Oscillospiraceae bacterium]